MANTGPLPMYPNQLTGATDINWPSYYSQQPAPQPAAATATGAPRPKWAMTNDGAYVLPDSFTDQDVQTWIQSWNARIAKADQAIEAANGYDKLKFQAQRDDLQKGLNNALQIAQLQGDTSRYGVDAQRQTAIENLAKDQYQYQQTHGLDVATAYTNFAKTPDAIWGLADFKDALANVGQGGGPTPVGAQPAAHANNWQDFQALQSYGQTPGGDRPTGAPGSPGSSAGGSGTGAPPDLRIKAANAVMQAIPPSQTPGHDSQDWAAIDAVKNLYFSGQPGAVARLGQARTQEAQGGLARAGYNPALVQEDYTRAGVGQGAARNA